MLIYNVGFLCKYLPLHPPGDTGFPEESVGGGGF